ncbi:MAG: ATP-binding protein, partial [Amaricoccus sp.]
MPAGAAEALAAAVAAAPPGDIGVAVSGGGDSVALLLLLWEAAAAAGRGVAAITIDHGLRPEAAEEAGAVAALAGRLGVPHAVRRWDGWDGRGNLQDRARVARRGLIATWAGERGIGAVALGHTLDDQAETVLLRLA